MRILCVTFLGDTHSEYFPLGMAFLAAHMRERGCDVRWVILSEGESAERLLGAAEGVDAAVISSAPRFYCTCPVPTVGAARAAARALKAARPGVRTVAVGPFATVRPAPFLADGFDAVACGEPEPAILAAIEGREAPGLALPDAAGGVRRTGPAPYADLAALAPPARDLVDLAPFVFETHFARRTTAIQSSRGCAFACRFCFINRDDAYARANVGRVVRSRRPDQVVAEIRDLRARHGVDGLFFEDPEFLIDRRRVEALCEALVRADLGVSWSAQSRVPDVDAPLLDRLRRAGCREIYYGVESGDPLMLPRTGKGVTLDDIERAFELTRAAGIRVTGSFILGLPGETEASAWKTIALARRLAPDHAVFHVYAPFPGTRWHDAAVAAGFLADGPEGLDAIRVHENRRRYRTEALSSEDLERLRLAAYRAFYGDPRFLVRSALKATPREALFYLRTALGLREDLRTAEKTVLSALKRERSPGRGPA